jgi:hypothetical protein
MLPAGYLRVAGVHNRRQDRNGCHHETPPIRHCPEDIDAGQVRSDVTIVLTQNLPSIVDRTCEPPTVRLLK